MEPVLSLYLAIVFSFFCFAVFANATLKDNSLSDPSDLTMTQIRSDGSILMWLKDANLAKTSGYDADGYMIWSEADAWIGSLNSSNYLGYNDWRLPDTLPADGISYDYDYSYDGSSDRGSNITSLNSEMTYMYYVELGNKGYYAPDGSNPQSGWGLNNVGPFINLQANSYWSGSEYAPVQGYAWYFNFYNGYQNAYRKDSYYHAWAVRPGDVAAPVPEPATIVLLIFGLGGIIGVLKVGQRRG